MPPKIVWTLFAREDIEAIKRAAKASGRPKAIETLKARLSAQLTLIQQFPLIGVATPDGPGIRQFRLNDFYKII
jgi:plasmid stabilization system protein ParE